MKTLPMLLLLVLLAAWVSYAGNQSRPAAARGEAQITSVAFCEMVEHPRLYFDKAALRPTKTRASPNQSPE